VLVALITVLGPVSGAHFNPAVTLAEAWRARTTWREIAANLVAQVAGAFVGTAVAHGMFGLSMFSASQHARTGPGQCLGEFVATFGLLAVAVGSSRARPAATPLVVAAWIAAAYWFTSSTSFANPAVTLARAASDTFAGIRPVDVPAFIGAQVLGAFAGACLSCWLLPAVRCAEVRG
jgi:glycerol uptake facilitator-like aquaporin